MESGDTPPPNSRFDLGSIWAPSRPGSALLCPVLRAGSPCLRISSVSVVLSFTVHRFCPSMPARPSVGQFVGLSVWHVCFSLSVCVCLPGSQPASRSGMSVCRRVARVGRHVAQPPCLPGSICPSIRMCISVHRSVRQPVDRL